VKQRIVIGITGCSKYGNYERWMLAEPGIDTICLSYKEKNLDLINRCDGILLTGGEDVHPRFYNMPEYVSYCDPDNMDELRDEFELKVLEYSQQNKIPVLGICRGLQIANVFFGGSLIPDIPLSGKPDHSKFQEGKDRYHEVRINPFSKLKEITGVLEGEVNSSHHQAADKIGKGLVAGAFSPDGVVEALERNSEEKNPYLMLVQWHPERMLNQDSALTKKIKADFLQNVANVAESA
jgi:putative glutamine amidotransferase